MGAEAEQVAAGRGPSPGPVGKGRAEELVAMAVESQRMGTGLLIMMVFGPLGILGLGFLWVSVHKLRRIEELGAIRGWWLGVGAAALAIFVAGELWGGGAESVPGAMFGLTSWGVPEGVPLQGALAPLALLALVVFHRAQLRFRMGLHSTAEAWAKWEDHRAEASARASS